MHVLTPLRPGSSWDPAATLATAGQRHSLASHAFRRLRSLTDMTRTRKARIKMKKHVFLMYFSKWSAWLPAALLGKLNISMKSTKKSTSPDLCWARSSKKACNCDIDLAFTYNYPQVFSSWEPEIQLTASTGRTSLSSAISSARAFDLVESSGRLEDYPLLKAFQQNHRKYQDLYESDCYNLQLFIRVYIN